MHWCATADEARDAVLEICRAAGARTVTKGKSMISEELGINDHLERHGITPVETDLGEYIIQLRHELPSHIIAPAFHLNREDWEDSFRKSHTDLPADRVFHERRDILTEARTKLRQKFLAADVGITGANFLIAETGSSVIVTNEGNGDLTQTLPRVHIVLASIEKMVPTIEDCTSLLRVLARSATGQDFSVYTTFSTGARRPGDLDGPDEYHVVLVDNGRSAMLGTEFQDMLRCIRCAACMNHCPVYGAVGGHAYGWVYPGPMGSVLTPALIGVDQAGHLPNASHLLRQVRERLPGEDPAAEADAPLAGARVRTPSDAAGGAHEPRRCGPTSRGGRRCIALATRARGAGRWGCWAASAAGSTSCRSPAAGPSGRDLPAPEGDTFFARYAREQRARTHAMSSATRCWPPSAAACAAGRCPRIRRQCCAARLAAHPRHLIPARSRGCRTPEQIALFVANVEKEFGTVDARARSRRRAGRGRGLPRRAEPADRHRDGAASGAAGDPLARPARCCGCARAAPRRPTLVSLQHAFAAHRGDRHADAALGAGAADHAEPAGGHRDRAAARSRVVGAYEEAWDLLRAELGGMPRNVMLVTGPSRSADIEQTLELGAHGPRRLHVVLVEDARIAVMPLWPLIATLAAQTLATMALFSLPAIAPAVAPALHVRGELVGVFVSVVYGVGIISALFSPGLHPPLRRRPRHARCAGRAPRRC